MVWRLWQAENKEDLSRRKIERRDFSFRETISRLLGGTSLGLLVQPDGDLARRLGGREYHRERYLLGRYITEYQKSSMKNLKLFIDKATRIVHLQRS